MLEFSVFCSTGRVTDKDQHAVTIHFTIIIFEANPYQLIRGEDEWGENEWGRMSGGRMSGGERGTTICDIVPYLLEYPLIPPGRLA